MRAGFEAELDKVVRDNPGVGSSSLRMARPEPVQDFTGDWITCFWFQQDDSLVCNGVDCFESATVRMDDVTEMAIGSSYTCANGCTVAPWVGFSCPGGGGGGVDNGGDPGGGGGGGGSSPASAYCPSSNPECLQPLRYQDEQKITLGLQQVDMARPICAQARDKAWSMFRLGQIYRGNPAIPDDPAHPHDAATRSALLDIDWIIHVDQDYLDISSAGGLAGLLLHEAWHVLGHPPHDEEQGPPYGIFPYSEQQSCILPG